LREQGRQSRSANPIPVLGPGRLGVAVQRVQDLVGAQVFLLAPGVEDPPDVSEDASVAGVVLLRFGLGRDHAGTVLLILGVPDVVVDAIMGWEPGGAARMRARYMHITGPMLRKVARQVEDVLWASPEAGGTAG
jgi:hypothetical protein